MRATNTVSTMLAGVVAITAPISTAKSAELLNFKVNGKTFVCQKAKTAQELADESRIANSVGTEHISLLGNTLTDTTEVTVAESSTIFQYTTKKGEVLDCVIGQTQRNLGVKHGHSAAPGIAATIMPGVEGAFIGGGTAAAGALAKASSNVFNGGNNNTGITANGGNATATGGKAISSSWSGSWSSASATSVAVNRPTTVNVRFHPECGCKY
jgi:hypothetical protein